MKATTKNKMDYILTLQCIIPVIGVKIRLNDDVFDWIETRFCCYQVVSFKIQSLSPSATSSHYNVYQPVTQFKLTLFSGFFLLLIESDIVSFNKMK